MLIESEQIAIPATWMRGGTSNALFFLAKDLPPPGEARDRLIKRAMGCPHVMQIDGIGGGRGNTSKVAIIAASDRDDADVDYTFAQVGIDKDSIDYRQTCGNISAAVGPFALAKGLVRPVEPITRIRIYNTNIDEILLQELTVCGAQPRLGGDFVNAGVPGSGAAIFTDFSRAVGTKTGKMLPTGNVSDKIALSDGRSIDASLLDVGNPVAYVNASDMGLSGTELPQAIMANAQLLATLQELRDKAAVLMGLAGKFSIRLGLVSPPASYTGLDGERVEADAMDLCSRFFALDYCAPSYPGSASVSSGAAARIPGSVVHALLADRAHSNDIVRIGHPLGVIEVLSIARPTPQPPGVKIERLGFARTARAIMDGVVYVPRRDIL